ncbi:MAG TPA: arginine--tRNA ligase [Candidatus Eisenbacteria bacterium]|jgi:arginyl-tRNA synthetase|nr:arginine--tRNA ligase [Candidatus Eisenbacteria bacterium]
MTKGSGARRPIQEDLSELLAEAMRLSGQPAASASAARGTFEVPREEKFGDLSTNFVFRVAKENKKAPRPMAEEVAGKLRGLLAASAAAGRVEKIAVEGPGFINFYFTAQETASVLDAIRSAGADYGRPKDVKPKKILLEFVSANPTGPLTVAHGRQAALGDSLARVLQFCGHQVTREYYNNDEGVQITTLGLSTQYRLNAIRREHDPKLPENPPIPENYYQGDYLIEIAGELYAKNPNAGLDECRLFARDSIMAGIKKDLADFGVHFDNFYSQEALGKSGKVEKTLEELKRLGKVYESEGAVWLKSTDFGDDKDRVLVKSDKNYTYLTPDIAYHHEKFLRGFEMMIDILGPDHHGYIARLKASQQALGHDPDAVNVLIAQLVTLYEGEKQVRMSTRAGEFVTLREILDEVGKDAGRFFFLMRKFDAHLDFDLALAKTQTPDNPIFYIQYAHARIESVKNVFLEKNRELPWDPAVLDRLSGPLETRVLRLLGQYGDNVQAAERTLEPYRVVAYLMELAGAFHRFYAENRVVTEDAPLTAARLMLLTSVQTVLRSGLGLLGVSAPLKM